MTKSEFLSFAHLITKSKNIAHFGGYRQTFATVLRDLYRQGYQRAVPAFQVHEPARWAGTPSRR